MWQSEVWKKSATKPIHSEHLVYRIYDLCCPLVIIGFIFVSFFKLYYPTQQHAAQEVSSLCVSNNWKIVSFFWVGSVSALLQHTHSEFWLPLPTHRSYRRTLLCRMCCDVCDGTTMKRRGKEAVEKRIQCVSVQEATDNKTTATKKKKAQSHATTQAHINSFIFVP